MRVVGQLGRFGVVGLALNAALYLFYLALTAMGIAPVVASTIAFIVGVPLSLTAHRRITFRVGEISKARKAGFAALYLAAYVTQIGVLSGLHYGLGVPHPLAQAVAICMAALCTFFIQKRAIFQA
ncbi:MAG: GtrA family protein [Silicimonas sp.]|nr:GtrA family protein [Silicimonas sp.]NNL74095.1 GtrA family protein [Silicimonas sp.]